MGRLKHEISINTNLEKIQRKKSTIEAIDTCEKMSESLLNSKEQEKKNKLDRDHLDTHLWCQACYTNQCEEVIQLLVGEINAICKAKLESFNISE